MSDIFETFAMVLEVSKTTLVRFLFEHQPVRCWLESGGDAWNFFCVAVSHGKWCLAMASHPACAPLMCGPS